MSSGQNLAENNQYVASALFKTVELYRFWRYNHFSISDRFFVVLFCPFQEVIMSRFPVGIQLYSVRDDLEADFEGTLKAVAEMGYEGVEFAGLYGHSVEEAKALCDKYNLDPVSTHIPFTDMIADPEGVIGEYAKLGVKYVVIPYLTEEFRPGRERFREVIEGAKVIGDVCKKYGIELLYHNHDFEFVKIDGEYALDILYREVPAALLKTELDTCWVNVGGEDPSAYIRKYSGRSPVVHLKDFVMPGKKPEKMYALIGIDEQKQGDTEEAEAFGFRPVGYGVQNIEEIIKASRVAGSKWLIVEQDMPALGKSAMECARMSIDFLKRVNN